MLSNKQFGPWLKVESRRGHFFNLATKKSSSWSEIKTPFERGHSSSNCGDAGQGSRVDRESEIWLIGNDGWKDSWGRKEKTNEIVIEMAEGSFTVNNLVSEVRISSFVGPSSPV